MVGEFEGQQEVWGRINEKKSDFKVTYLIWSLPQFPNVGIIYHSYTNKDTEAQRHQIIWSRSCSRERFQPWVYGFFSTTLLLWILQLSDVAE